VTLLVCLDLDGTVLDTSSRLPGESVALLLAELHDVGGHVSIMTARPIQDVARLFARFDMPIDVWASDGACRGTVAGGDVTGVHDEVWLVSSTVTSTIQALIDDEANPEILIFGTSQDGFEIVGHGHEAASASAAHLRTLDDLRPFRYEPQAERFLGLAGVRPIRAIGCLGVTESVAGLARRHEARSGAQHLHYAETRIPGLAWFDVTEAGASKGAAVQIVRCEIGAGCFVIAAGNGANDVSMFEAADLSVCPDDSDARLQELATHRPGVACGAPLVDAVRELVVATAAR
jgi:hydroxymethylpyrimidine pyrophosphatase-like HAD family hydrolase